ncbi:MAG: hypothetical protein NPIRA02_23690 [Nitrospirales bacterium]|nr:MAG: hypothetical protein NPIRA02_23690 [Nitrospirales bacterium]
MKKVMIVIGCLLGLLLLVILTVPYWLDLNRYREQYIPIVEQALNRKIEISHIRAMWYPQIGLHIEGAKIFDDPSITHAPFVEVPSIEVAIKWKPLLQRRIEIHSLTLDQPRIMLVRGEEDTLNTATLGQGTPKSSDASTTEESPESVFAMLGVEQLTISNGTLRYEDHSQEHDHWYQLENIEMKTESVRVGATAQFSVHGTLIPSQLPVSLEGIVGPLQPNLDIPKIEMRVQLGQSGLNAKGHIREGMLALDLSSSKIASDDLPFSIRLDRPVFMTQFFAHLQAPVRETDTLTLVQTDLQCDPLQFQLEMGESILTVSGRALGRNLKIHATTPVLHSQDIPISLPLHRPVSMHTIDVHATVDETLIHIDALTGTLFDGHVTAHGTWNMRSEVPAFQSTGTFEHIKIEEVQQILQPTPVTVQGTGEMNWDLKGTVPEKQPPHLFGRAHLAIANGQLQGFDLLKHIERVLKLKGLLSTGQGVTRFAHFHSDVDFRNEQFPIKSAQVQGRDDTFLMQGSGMIMRDRSMHITGDLRLGTTISKKIIQHMPIAKMALEHGSLAVPFTVNGYITEPAVGLDFGAIQRRLQKQVGSSMKKILEGSPKEMEELLHQGKDLFKHLFGK